MSNTQIAIDWFNQMTKHIKPGGTISFAMFPDATKHDIKVISKAITSNAAVSSATINKQYAIVKMK